MHASSSRRDCHLRKRCSELPGPSKFEVPEGLDRQISFDRCLKVLQLHLPALWRYGSSGMRTGSLATFEVKHTECAHPQEIALHAGEKDPNIFAEAIDPKLGKAIRQGLRPASASD